MRKGHIEAQEYLTDISSEYPYRMIKDIGKDVYISRKTIIKRPTLLKIGSNVSIDAFCYITTQLTVGDYCHIAPMVSIIGGANSHLTMGNFSHLAAGVRIICATDEHLGEGLVSPVIPEKYRDKIISIPVVIGAFATVGTNSVIMPGVIMGEGAVLAANSFIKKDIPSWEIWGGSPAKFIKKRPIGNMKSFAKELGYYVE